MTAETGFEEELKAEEKKHKKILKYDLETFIVLIVIVAFVVFTNLMLKSSYKPVGKVRAGIAPALIECNKSILNVGETFRKNTTDDNARIAVDAAKLAFDGAIAYYGKSVTKGVSDGIIVSVLDSCYQSAVHFHNVISTQQNLDGLGVSTAMLTSMDNDIRRLKEKADSLMTGIDAYNSTGFFLTFSWVTPYPSTIAYDRIILPEMQPMATTTPAEKPESK
ncbi:MAG TPA: hypothetical protein VLY03_09025 [Bacteroidota bacterium]|nr:hypothetical protein [Bacteroidota bacterium]